MMLMENQIEEIHASAENIKRKTSDNNRDNISGIGILYASPVPSTSKLIEKGIVEPTNTVAVRVSSQQKSPKNDLSEIVSVKKLKQTPKKQKSPKNDLTNIRLSVV